jgi:glycosyltransferase involved in cell wall biosynthesis
MPTLHQFTPTLDAGAVGAHLLEIQRTLRAAGWDSEVFAERAVAPYQGRAHPHTDYGTSVAARREDVVVYHTAIGSVVGDWLMARRPARLVIDYHNITPPSWFEGWLPDLAYGLGWGRGQLRRLARRARFGLADSAFNAAELADVGFRATAVLPILVPAGSLGGAPSPALVDRLRSQPGGRWVFVGRLAPNKRQHLIVGALSAYRRAYDPSARLFLVGGTSAPHYETALRRYIAELGLQEAVTITGPVSDADRNAYYAAADVFVCLSGHEGFCVPLLEAWYHDLPIVASAGTAVTETLGDGGILLPGAGAEAVAAAVARVVTDPAVGDAVRAAGRARLEEYSLARAEARLLDLADGLANRGLADAPSLERLRGGA